VNDGIEFALLYPGAAAGEEVVITKPDQIPNLRTGYKWDDTAVAGLAGAVKCGLSNGMILDISLK
jgi:hypothetical protein